MGEVPIVIEHDEFCVVNKPAGMKMHAEREHSTLSSALGIADIVSKQIGTPKLYLTHRLDTPTSGCILLAKTQSAASALSQEFEQRRVLKYYIALSDKKPKKKQGRVSGDMQNVRNGSYRLLHTQHRPAITFFHSYAYSYQDETQTHLQSINQNVAIQNLRFFYVKPVTGKTHQIRVALKSLGSTILGDERYKGSTADRLYLHSHSLRFQYLGQEYHTSCLPQTGTLWSQSELLRITSPDELQWPSYKAPLSNKLKQTRQKQQTKNSNE